MKIYRGHGNYPKQPITSLSVAGYKCFSNKKTISIKPLTILAGANSSGKSSMMQPLLLLKQTIEAGYDPGPLLINGPNVKYSAYTQMFSKTSGKKRSSLLKIDVGIDDAESYEIHFRLIDQIKLILDKFITKNRDGDTYELSPRMRHDTIMRNLPDSFKDDMFFGSLKTGKDEFKLSVETEEKFFLITSVTRRKKNKKNFEFFMSTSNIGLMQMVIADTIHVPAFRGNPERSYPGTYSENVFIGRFDSYVAGIISSWELNKDRQKLNSLFASLKKLGLADKIITQKVSDVEVELYVNQSKVLAKNRTNGRVSIADVGFGVSQVLPVLVSLLVSREGQLVYIEQPEIHLHPRAINKLAELIADAANRGVRVVIETHSQILIKSLQTLIANNYISSDKTIIHWFSKDTFDAESNIFSTEPDENGAYGNLPIDLDETYLFAESDYWKSAVKFNRD